STCKARVLTYRQRTEPSSFRARPGLLLDQPPLRMASRRGQHFLRKFIPRRYLLQFDSAKSKPYTAYLFPNSLIHTSQELSATEDTVMSETHNAHGILDVVHSITSNRESGELEISSSGSHGVLRFNKGRLVDARLESLTG